MPRIPKITSMDTALRIFYTYPEIGNKEIAELFGSIATTTVCALKRKVRKYQTEKDIKITGIYTVNTVAAYEAWGIDVDDLEKRRKNLKRLGLDEKTA